MKSFFLIALLMISFTLELKAQENCRLSLPSETQIISKSPLLEKLGKDQTYWICNSAQVIFRAGNAVIFIDKGAKVTLSHGEYTVYLKDQAKLILHSGAKVSIYYEGNPVIETVGIYNSENKFACNALEIDFSRAPAGICPPPQNYTPPQVPAFADTSNLTGLQTEPQYADLEKSYIIPSEAQQIPFQIRIENTFGDGKVFWLCKNAKSTHQGNHSIFYLEEDAELTLKLGDYNTIFLKKGCRLKLGPGRENKVYYEEEVTLTEDQSFKTHFTKLSLMEYDYSRVSKEACR